MLEMAGAEDEWKDVLRLGVHMCTCSILGLDVHLLHVQISSG